MRLALSVAVAISLSLLAARSAFALGGTLTTPSISVATASGRDAKDWLAVLANKKYAFIVGDFINATTNLYYAGDTASLNSFLSDLAAVDGTEIEVMFSKESKDASSAFGSDQGHTGPCQWQIQHLGYTPEVFHVTVFLGDGKIDIAQLALPPIHSAKAKSPDEKSVSPPKPRTDLNQKNGP
jgi:hypothetical protein